MYAVTCTYSCVISFKHFDNPKDLQSTQFEQLLVFRVGIFT